MSFNDFGSGNGSGSNRAQSSSSPQTQQKVSTPGGAVAEIGDMLTKFQTSCNNTKSKIDNASKVPLTASTKTELDGMVKSLKEQARLVKEKLDAHVKQVNELPRDQATARRVSVIKLQRDYERVATQYQAITRDHGSLRVERTNATNSQPDSFSNAYDNSNNKSQSHQLQQQPVMHELIDVDEAIIEEREKDIKKINQELLMVNEMFRDMADIVGKQGETITKIEQDSEVSRERAKEGLDQVVQASKYQPTCLIS